MKDILKHVGENIRKTRIIKVMSQKDLALILKVDKAYISRLENGKNNLTLNSLSKIANALSLDIKKLLD